LGLFERGGWGVDVPGIGSGFWLNLQFLGLRLVLGNLKGKNSGTLVLVG